MDKATLISEIERRARQVEASRTRFCSRRDSSGKPDLKAYFLRQISRCDFELARLHNELNRLRE